MMALAGCTPLKMTHIPIKTSAGDWIQYGGSPARTNRTQASLTLPLKRVWDYDADAGFAPYSAVAEGGYIIVGNLHGDIHVMDVKTGKGKVIHGFGSSVFGSPIIDGSTLYVALANDEENIVAYDLSASSFLWKTRLPGIETSPLLIASRIYVSALTGELFCIDKSNGAIRWSYANPFEKLRSQSHSSPAGNDSIVVYGHDDGDLTAIDAMSGTLRWNVRAANGLLGSPILVGERVIAGASDSTISAFDLRTGSLLWNRRLGGRIFSPLSAGTGTIYAGTASGILHCLNLRDGSNVWQYAAKNGFCAAPLVAGNFIFAGSLDRSLTALDADSGAVRWQWTGEARIKTTPIIHDNTLIILQDDRTIMAFREDKPGGEGKR